MAEYNPDAAFLQNMQDNNNYGYDPNAQEADFDDSEEEDYDPSALDFGVPAADVPEPQAAQPDEQLEVEPESRTETPITQAAAAYEPPATKSPSPVTQVPAKQPRTVGGFVVDDEDDEDDAPATAPSIAGSNGQIDVAGESPGIQQRSSTQTPLNNTLHPPDTSIDIAAQDQGTQGVADSAPNGAAVSSSSGADLTSQAPTVPSPTMAQAPVQPVSASILPAPKARLSQDRVGIYEDRIAEDPRGDIDAWLSLISEHKQRNKIAEVREVYERFFKVFPSAADQWVEYVKMELEHDDFARAEAIFTKTLPTSTSVKLWSVYLDYVRRRNNVNTDPKARQTIQSAFEFTLGKIGIDITSGHVWADYLNFAKAGPGVLGGTNWQDSQKMDGLRTLYRRALSVPTQNLNSFWTEYQQLELGLNKVTGRKFMAEKMPVYMTAKIANNAISNKVQNLVRTTLPRLPPAPGFAGFEDYEEQVRIWKDWIAYEQGDPLTLQEEDPNALKERILYLYKQVVMSLRFEPQMWVEAADFCFSNDMESEGNDLLKQGIEANPESCLLAFKQGDRVEQATAQDSDPEKRGHTIREPYQKLLDALYDLIKKVQARQDQEIARIKEAFKEETQEQQQERDDDDDDDMDDSAARAKAAADREKSQIDAVKNSATAQITTLRKTLTAAWIALLRATRRVQGAGNKGKLDDPIPGSRGIMAQARKRGQLTSDIYIAQAQIEHNCYRNASAAKLFNAGLGLFPDDENLALEYVKHLIDINDMTNARAIFEKSVSRLTSKPETTARAKPLYLFFHNYESKYGELTQISKLEQRMQEHFPDDPSLKLFAHRYMYTNALNQTFDPTLMRPIISPATQMRIGDALPSIEKSPTPLYDQQASNLPSITLDGRSPKRPFAGDDSDQYPPRKLQRGESPLKGAAGRRLDAARRRGGDTPQHAANLPPPPLPRDVNFLLSVLPKKELSQNMNPQIIPAQMVHLLRSVDLDRVDWSRANLKAAGPGLLQAQRLAPQAAPQPQMGGYGAPPPPMSIPPPQQAPPQMYSPATQYPPVTQYPQAPPYAYGPPPVNGMYPPPQNGGAGYYGHDPNAAAYPYAR